jgi:hypothetical protein
MLTSRKAATAAGQSNIPSPQDDLQDGLNDDAEAVWEDVEDVGLDAE